MKINFFGYRKYSLAIIIIALGSVFLGLKWVSADIWKDTVLGAGAFYLGSNIIAGFAKAKNKNET